MKVLPKNAFALYVALGEILVHDELGEKNNPYILDYAADLEKEYPGDFKEYKNDDTSWCALFMNWVMLQIEVPGTRSLAARGFLNFGVKVTDAPLPGDIAVFWRVDPKGWQGHVAFYLNEVERDGKKYIRLLGGNQGDEVKVIEFPASQLLDIRRITPQ